MAAPGNQNGLALKNPSIRQKAYQSFCAHRAKGKDVKSWWYEDKEGNKCTWMTMLTYMKDNPMEFEPIHREIAESKGYEHWENVVAESAIGKNKKANTASLQMIMRNKYGWDKKEEVDVSQESLNVLQGTMSLLKKLQDRNIDCNNKSDESKSA